MDRLSSNYFNWRSPHTVTATHSEGSKQMPLLLQIEAAPVISQLEFSGAYSQV